MEAAGNDMSSLINDPSLNLFTTIGAAFYGYSAGAILFGVTIRQAFQYYTTCENDTKLRKLLIGVVCCLDTLHLTFSIILIYSVIVGELGRPSAGTHAVWSLKGLGTAQTFMILCVQGFYLSQIWRLSTSLAHVSSPSSARLAHIFVVFIATIAISVAALFLSQLQKINSIFDFSSNFEDTIYIGFGATALVDCSIAAAMCLLVRQGSGGTRRSDAVIERLILYFMGSGLVTGLAAILCIILYVIQPNTLLYLGMEFSVTRLYANSLLAISNARGGLRSKFDKSLELKLPTHIYFGGIDDSPSRQHSRPLAEQVSPASQGTESPGSGWSPRGNIQSFSSVLSPTVKVRRGVTI